MQSNETAAHRISDLPAEAEPDAFVDELTPGTVLLNGQYTIISFLNSGGFGITYLAKDSLDRTVVIKECFPNSLCRRSDTIVRARSRAHQGELRSIVRLFVQEARSLAKLVHPNIVGVHQVFEDNDTAYMAIDYVNGKDLLEILESSDQSFTQTEIVGMLKKTLCAVEFIHQAGILHRDISPDNILIDAHKNPILIDFGAAREQASKASRVVTARRVVKDGYSPQEFYLTGAAQGPYSDVYALGATFYHVIAGQAPPESQRRLAAIAEGTPDPYRNLAGRFAGYPPGFLESIDKANRVLPKDRVQTAALWLELIEESLAGASRKVGPQSRAVSSLRARSRIVTNMISPVAAAETAPTSWLPVLFGTTVVAALALGLGLWLMAGGIETAATAILTVAPATDAIPAEDAKAADTGRLAAEAQAKARLAAEAEAAAKAEQDARLAAESAAKAEQDARLAAEVAAAAKAEDDARLAAEAAAKAEEDARLAAEAEAAAKAEEDARIAAEVAAAAKAEEDARLAAEAEAAAKAEEDARIAAEAEAEAEAAAKAEEDARLTAEVAAKAEEDARIAAEAEAAAAAEAASAARAAALAAVTPRPALADAPVLDDQFAEVRWDYALPFTTEARNVDGDTFPVVTEVNPKALTGSNDDAWIVPGVTIYAINGEWVADGAAIQDLMRVSTTPDEYGLIAASVRIRGQEEGLFEQVTLVVPTTRSVTLKNGTTVRTESVNGEWRSTVDTITYSDPDGILPDDIILGETTLGQRVDSAESFEVIIDLLAFRSAPEANFEVLRKGKVIAVRMPLARQ